MAGEQRRSYFVKAGAVPGYHPAHHTGTTNRRLIGADTVGATQVEVVLGVIAKGRGALPHAHPGIEQVCYVLEGAVHAEVGGETCDLEAGDCCFFPPDVHHSVTVLSDTPARLLVIYAPPYEEHPDRVVRK